MKYFKNFQKRFILSKSNDEDLGRREYILNILVSGAIFLALVSFLLLLYDKMSIGEAYRGLSPLVSFMILLLFVWIYVISRKGYVAAASRFFLLLFLVPTTYFLYRWGVDLPIGLLFAALIIIISGVLISTKYAFKITIFLTIYLLALTWLQSNYLIKPNLYWKLETINIGTVFVFAIILFLIAIVSWLSNREIEKSLLRARRSEAELKNERDNLEKTVEKRTQELKLVQLEKMAQLSRFAEFGRLSSGLFHDLINPLTAVSMYLGNVEKESGDNLSAAKLSLSQAISVTKKMEDFVIAIRKQIQKQDTKKSFCLNEEIMQCVQIFSYKARKIGVNMIFEAKKDIRTYGDQIKFSQLTSNLLSNAIDSCEGMPEMKGEKLVSIKLEEDHGVACLTVEDNGCGIPEGMVEKIFDPFFTTKTSGRGTGIGLSSSRHIAEQDFGGAISIESNVGKGTVFKVVFPLNNRVN